MPAYIDRLLKDFIEIPASTIEADLHRRYALDGFSSQYTSQTKAWSESIPILQAQLRSVCDAISDAAHWRILLEFPLYRLRRRIDVVLLTDTVVVVIELKVGETKFHSADRRQVEEYALDLYDFHETSTGTAIVPALWATAALDTHRYVTLRPSQVSDVQMLGEGDLVDFLTQLNRESTGFRKLARESWASGAYRPVPSVIEAATTLFAGHGVEAITRADATNLESSARRIVEIVDGAKEGGFRALVFLTGVPGSGKTLAGLQVVHRSIADGVEDDGDIIYLSGNTPLVTVLREALARDDYRRKKLVGERPLIADVRASVRARIQHIIDFLRQYLSGHENQAAHEHAIVFDEAQRAWDAKYGHEKFGRSASEPTLLLEIMGRHKDWCVLVGLVGGGQEINKGENGIREWGDALRGLDAGEAARWKVYGPPTVLNGDHSTAFLGLGNLPTGIEVVQDTALRLDVSLRNYRSPRLADWVSAVIEGRRDAAAELADKCGDYPIFITRSLETTRSWLRRMGRGERRYGLVASSGARRLRAYGLGVSLDATDGSKIAQWYLNEPDDVRSSYALEVTANEYTTQGLELESVREPSDASKSAWNSSVRSVHNRVFGRVLDFIGLCWDGDFLFNRGCWECREFRGNRWNRVSNPDRKRFIENSYRVLLTRAREGVIIWVPSGNHDDATRDPGGLDATASFLSDCGAEELRAGDS